MFRFLFKKQKKKAASFIQNCEEGYLRCESCSKKQPLPNFNPLHLEACPYCGNYNFIPLLISRYWLVEPLGGGGMGSVYKAYKREDPFTAVAVKLISAGREQDEEAINALYQEADIAQAAGDHPCLAGVLERGKADDRHYAIMEFIHGERLDNVVDHVDYLPVDQVLQIGLDIIDADWHLYNKGYLYRDLKPQNIILHEETKKAVLFDYGLCVTLDQAQTPDGETCAGSPHFVPPERLRGMPEGICSEIYSLGMVMYYALTGSTFFSADEAQELANKHISELRIPMRAKLKGYPDDIVQLMTKMTQKEQDKRYQTFKELKDNVSTIRDKLSE